jgi:hypothetical protein
LVGIEPEIIQCAPANRISVLIGRKGFRVPGDRGVPRHIIVFPRGAAIARISLGAIVKPAGMLRRRVKTDVSDIDSWSQRHAKGLNGAIKVHVKERVLIVPDASRRIGYLVAHEPNPIVARIRLDPGYWGAGDSPPSNDGRLHSEGASRRRKGERVRTAANRKRTIREIVEHVALVWMGLTPGEFMGGDVSGFAKVAHTRN